MNFLVSAVAGILSWLGLKAVETARKFAMFAVLVGVNSALIVAFLAYLGLIVSLLLWVFNKFNELLAYINAPMGDDLLSTSFKVLKASGAWDGAVDGFSAISGGFLLLFTLFLTRLTIKALLHFRFTVFSLILSVK